ncbi:hypothetical protein [Photobacterium damselae]|uniref:hypothetical protein n=1 Tax=Photobacterium damselae TaxID=38293 RepID=UPI0040676E70
MKNYQALLNFKKSVNYDALELSENDFIDECHQQLLNYRDNNTPITDPLVIAKLHDLYAGDDNNVTLFRGLLFENENQTSKFNSSIEGGYLSNGLPSALSSNKSIAKEFATTQKTYDDMDLARAFSEKRQLGEVVTGYEGSLISVDINTKYCIDMSKAGLSVESEFLMLPCISAKIIADERQIPFSRMFDSGELSIESVVNDRSEQQDDALNYVLINFSEQLTKQQIDGLCKRYNAKEKHNQNISNKILFDADTEILKRAENTEQVQFFKKNSSTNSHSEDDRDGIFVHPNGCIMKEWNTSVYVGYKSVNKVLLCAEIDVSPEVLDLANRGLLYQEQIDEITDKCNLLCQAIADATHHKEFRATELEDQTSKLLRDFGSPISLKIMGDALSPNRHSELNVLNDKTLVSSKNDLRNHSDIVKKSLGDFIKGVASGKPSENRPKPRV